MHEKYKSNVCNHNNTIFSSTILPTTIALQGFTDGQIQMVDDNSAVIIEREKELNHIVQSIADLNEIFRDLAVMVVEQVCCNAL